MKPQRIILFFFISTLFFNCAAKKTITEYKDKIVKDTIYKTEVKTVLKPIKDTLLIEKPCDTSGLLKPFKYVLNNEKAKVIVENVKGNIKVDVNIDSIVNSRVNEFKSSFKKDIQIKEKEVVRYKTPFWLLVCLGVSVLLNVALFRVNRFL